MIQVRTTETRETQAEWAGQRVGLVSRALEVGWSTPWGSWAGVYHRPVGIELDDGGARILISDPVMLARILAVAVPVLVRMWRLFR